MSTDRRGFFKKVAAGAALAAAPEAASPQQPPAPPAAAAPPAPLPMRYPRVYTGRQLATIAFPLGGVATGSISLGGRGQFRDWEIFNRPDKGRSPGYAMASIWAQTGKAKPVARVLESRLLPPYASTSGLGPANAPGLSRLARATFTGEFPMARIDFADSRLPVRVSLEAFSPFVPLDPEASGLPVAVLRYRVKNPGAAKATVSIAFSLDNPIAAAPGAVGRAGADGRAIEFRRAPDADGAELQGLYMTNPGLAETDTQRGSLALCLMHPGDGRVTYLRGWPAARWWASPNLFWDDFSSDGALGPEAERRRPTGSLCLQRDIAPGAEAVYEFLLAWHFPNRTPAGCGWSAPRGHENDVTGNYYCTRFADAWAAADHALRNLPDLEKRTRAFLGAMRESTLPAALRDAAMSNLSTLVTQTSFRTADGEFHGFEGSNDRSGCCHGNCTHVWNYETATQYVFPTFARSLRNSAFGYSLDEQGAMRFRQTLPDGIERSGWTATDGQMGQIIKIYLDWKLSGDTPWLRGHWPAVQRALAFAWIKGGWDPNRDGVMEGVQHNTYDVEFYGPNPQCGVYYLGALRAAEEMARAMGDDNAARDYHGLFEKGRAWIDANLFNGEYYIQQVRGIPKADIAPLTMGNMGAENTEQPEFQAGEGCLADQLIGQYHAGLAGLGPLLEPKNIRKTLESIRKYNHRANLFEHDSTQRIYALNDEPAVLVCDYGKVTRPRVPFPYYAEAWTGIEYLVAALFLQAGMVREGVETVEDVRRRYDGERRNPWDEPECGHHYARAMSSWSTVVAYSGFDYHGAEKTLTLQPCSAEPRFVSFWSSGTGWGVFTIASEDGRARLELKVIEGSLPIRSLSLPRGGGGATSVTLDGQACPHRAERQAGKVTLTVTEDIAVPSGGKLVAAY